jgi:threonine efflux protein
LDFVALLPPLGFFAVNVVTPGPNVLTTIGISLGSGRAAGYGCAAACGVGVLVWAAAALLGAGALFAAVPETRAGLTVVGAVVLLYFAFRYARRAMMPPDAVARIEGTTPRAAFSQSLMVLASNPKALTTWVAMLTIFPIISRGWDMMLAFAFGCAMVATLCHVFYATLFSSNRAARIYALAVRPVNGAVAIGFTIYAVKLLLDVAAE